MPSLAPKEWSRQANQLQKKAGKPLDRPDIEKKIGKPNGSVTRRQSLEKGGSWKPRSGDRSGQANRRLDNLKRSTPPLTDEQKKSNRNQQRRHARANAKIKDYPKKKTVGHKEPAWKSGEQHRRLEEQYGKEHADEILDRNHKAREKVGGGLGDHPNNRQTESLEDNGKAHGEYEQLEGALEEMERKNPSNPDNPSAHYIQPSPAIQSIIDDTFNYATTKTAPSLAEAEKAFRVVIAIGGGLLRLTGSLLKPGGV